MKCPHCGEEITNRDKIIYSALQAAVPDKRIEQVKYNINSECSRALTDPDWAEFSADGTFIVGGELKQFSIAFDHYRRLTYFRQECK